MISIIAAVSKNNIIGKDNELPWYLPEDLKHFKEKTTGHPIIMGWNTWQSLGEKPLPGRTNVILSRRPRNIPRSKDIKLIHNFLDIKKFKNPFVIGGGSVYSEYISLADKLYITIVDINIYGNSCIKFPNIDNNWKLSNISEVQKSISGLFYQFNEYVRL